MQFSVEKIDDFKRHVKVEMTAEEVAPFFKRAYSNVASKARIDGFRKGKAPKNVIMMQFGSTVMADALDDIIKSNYGEAVKQLGDATIADTPSIVDSTPVGEGKDLSYAMEFVVLPEVSLKPLADITVERPVCELTDEIVDNYLENMRKSSSKWQVVDDLEVQDGTQADINFLGKIDGTPFEGGEAKNFKLNVSETAMIPGFTEQIKGHKAGDEFVIDVTFPEDYHAEELKGKAATFDIKVNSVARMDLLSDEDLLKEIGQADSSIEQIKKNIRVNMGRTLEDGLRAMRSKALTSALGDAQDKFALPEVAIEREREALARRSINRLLRSFGGGKLDDKLVKSLIENAKQNIDDEEASKSVREELVFNQYVKERKLSDSLSKEEVDALLRKEAARYDENVDEFIKFLDGKPDSRMSMENSVIEQYIIDELYKLVKVVDKPVSFEEVAAPMMNPGF